MSKDETKTELKTYDDFKKEMSTHWEEEIISPKDLQGKSSLFYINHIQEYSTNCLFLELLDLQIHLSKQIQNFESFQFIYPIFDEYSIDIFRRPDDPNNRILMKGTFMKDIENLSNKEKKNNLTDFLNDNPKFDYYFWNVTFPNIFLGFISDEYCDKAVKFLTLYESDINIFKKGVTSFINHNYYFQDSFMKSFFINSQKENGNIELNLQNSLIKALQKLNIHQLTMLVTIIDKYPEEAEGMFIKKIIIHNIKLWKYSPLYSPFQFDLIDHLKTQFIDGENHKENLSNFLDPVFKAVKTKATINDIKIPRLIFNTAHKFVFTFLDFLIIEKVNKSSTFNGLIGPLLDNFDEKYLFKEAFSYFICDKHEPCPKDMEDAMKVKVPNFDITYVNKWNLRKEDCIKHNKNPLGVFYKKDEEEELNGFDPELAYTGIASSYYDWLSYTKTKSVLKNESRALLPLKAILDSQSSFIEVYCTCYASKRPLNGDFLESLKNLFKTTMKNIMVTFIELKFKQNYSKKIKTLHQYIRDENKKKNNPKQKFDEKLISKYNNDIQYFQSKEELLPGISSKYEQLIDDEFSQNFDFYFNHKENGENLFALASKVIVGLLTELDPKSNYSVATLRPSFDKYVEYMQLFTRSFLITSFSNVKVNIVQLNDNIRFAKLSQDYCDCLAHYNASGIFNYISGFVDSLKNNDYTKTKMIPIGQVFAAVPTIKKFLEQFVDRQNTKSFLQAHVIGSEKELTMLILQYTFKFFLNGVHDVKGQKEKEINDKTTCFITFLDTAKSVLDSFNYSLPYFEKLSDEFLYIRNLIEFGSDSTSISISDSEEP